MTTRKETPKAPVQSEIKRRPDGTLMPGGANLNPAGRPVGAVSLVGLLRQKLGHIPEGQRKSFAEGIVDATVRDALAGDSAARKLVWEYTEGTAQQNVHVTGGLAIEQLADEDLDVELTRVAAAIEAAEAQARAGEASPDDRRAPVQRKAAKRAGARRAAKG